jgi:hypothetical protein
VEKIGHLTLSVPASFINCSAKIPGNQGISYQTSKICKKIIKETSLAATMGSLV